MKTYLTSAIKLPIDADLYDKHRIARHIGVKPSEIHSVVLHKRSIDARDKNNIKIVSSYIIRTDDKIKLRNVIPYIPPVNVLEMPMTTARGKVAVIGGGPAGLFAALYILKSGINVTLYERGYDVFERVDTVNSFANGGALDTECNVQFGLGGAGAFSDGKLTSGISSQYTYTVFDTLTKMGAPSEIMYDGTPHIGTDKLIGVIANIRDEIRNLGGKIVFGTKLVGIRSKSGVLQSAIFNCGKDAYEDSFDAVVLAVGHSARDTVRSLYADGVAMAFKPFAVGVRVEHDRRFISRAQYGVIADTHRDFASANYKMAVNLPNGRSCYTFCMCPGGMVVAAASEHGGVVVNGMSNYDRMADNSNSAIVVNVARSDLSGDDIFCGMDFQRKLESDCYTVCHDGGKYVAPCQNVVDFLSDRQTQGEWSVIPSYSRGVKSINLRRLLPPFVAETIAEGLRQFGKRIDGFDKSGVLTAVESRTSSSIRILRGDDFQSVGVKGLYPCGEGAGYAGGIVSAAVDGLKVAFAVSKRLSR
ncbi:MAG: FAD-dependent oxidoreductase [Corallococcus sp.]|nr:FAD-dependent oxidoreductase [Corallococcus sp.]